MKHPDWRCFFLMMLLSSFIMTSYASPPFSYQFDHAKSDTARLAACIKLIKLYNITYKYDSCQFYIDKGLKLVEKTKPTVHHAEFYRVCSLLARKKGQLVEAINLLNKGRYWGLINNQASVVGNIDYVLATLYTDKALISNKKLDFKVALEKIYKNIQFADKHHLLNTEAANYSILAEFYMIYRNDSIAFSFLEKIIELKEKDTLSAIQHEYKNKDIEKVLERDRIHILINKFQLSIFHKQFKQAEAYLSELRSRSIKSDIYYYGANLGPVEDYTRLGYFDQAIKTGSIVEKNDRMMALMPKKDKSIFYCYLTSAYLARRKYSDARKVYQKSIMYADYEKDSEFKIPKNLRMRYLKNKKEILIQEQHFREAVLVANELELLKDSINSNQTVFELAAGQERFESKVKEDSLTKQIQLHELENKYKGERIEQSKKIQWLSALIIMSLIFVILFVIIQKNQTKTQAIKLKKSNDTQNKIFGIISHDLRSPVAGLQAYLSNINSTAYSKTLAGLEIQVDVVLNTLDNLLNWSITQMNGIKPRLERINLRNSVEHIIELAAPLIQHKSILLFIQLDDEYVLADENLTEVVIRNVLNNAIKFTHEEGSIKLSAKTQGNEYILQIQDYGIGMTAEQIDNLFLNYNSRKGTMGEKGSGLGLKLSQDLMAMQGGRIDVKSAVNVGTVVSLVFKK